MATKFRILVRLRFLSDCGIVMYISVYPAAFVRTGTDEIIWKFCYKTLIEMLMIACLEFEMSKSHVLFYSGLLRKFSNQNEIYTYIHWILNLLLSHFMVLKFLGTQFQRAPRHSSRLELALTLDFFFFPFSPCLVQFCVTCQMSMENWLWFIGGPIGWLINSPRIGSSIGSNSPSAQESLFHAEFEFTGLKLVWLFVRLGRSVGRSGITAFSFTAATAANASFGVVLLTASSFASCSSSFCGQS